MMGIETKQMLKLPSWQRANDRWSMTKNLNVDPRLLGISMLNSPTCQFDSGQRQGMFSSNLVQALIPNGAEMPQVATGFEYNFSKYTANTTRIPQAGTTLACIPKYKTNIGMRPIRFNPSYVLIYLGEEDNLVHYCDISHYTKGTDGFGYENYINPAYLRAGVGLIKDMTISHSKAVQGSQYGFGVNANIAYITMKETVEDAFVMSRSLANRLTSTGIKTLSISIDRNMIPLNMYGGPDEYKFIPDIHETVREDGILCAFREVNEASMISDMTDRALMTPQYLHDDIHYAVEPGAVVIDVDIYKTAHRQIKTQETVFEQADKYIENSLIFHKQILDVYDKECVKGGRQASQEFKVLVDRAVQILGANKQKYLGLKSVPKFTLKGEPLKFIHMVITYRYENRVNNGYKITNAHGGKGVLSVIYDDEDMPINDEGIRADLIVGPESVVNRMNCGQLYTMFINMCMHKVICNIRNMNNVNMEYDHVLEFINRVNPEYLKIIQACHQSDKDRINFVSGIKQEDKLIIVCPPFLNTLTIDWVDEMVKLYNIKSTPVEYNLRDGNGNLIRRVRTINPVHIGKNYLYILCKIPHARSAGMSYVNQFQIPVRIKTKRHKSQSPIGLVPIRLGEDEIRNCEMVVGDMALRILQLYANSPGAGRELVKTLLTANKPTQVDWINITDEQMRAGNNMIKVAQHLLSTCGVDITDVGVTPEQYTQLQPLMNKQGVVHCDYKSESDD